MKKFLLLIVFPLFILASCGKYEEGPHLSFRSKKSRLTGYWVAEKTYINGNQQNNYSSYYDIQKDGDFGNDGTNGTWSFSDNKEKVIFTTNGFFTTTSEVKILKLTNKEWWIEYTILGQLMEIHYAKTDND